MKLITKTRLSKGWLTGLVLGLMSSAALLVFAAAITSPLNQFTSDTPISSAEVNDNFDGIVKATYTCPGNDATDEMVRVGPLCVDKYEASVWATAAGGGTQFGVGSDTYLCSDNGNDCSAGLVNSIYARSQAGVFPAQHITWFQAQQACANVGKRLLTNAEWQMAAAGTPDNNSAICNTLGGPPLAAPTNAHPTCVSNWGVINMVGNVWEWVADWIQADGTDFVLVTVTGLPEVDIQSSTFNLLSGSTAINTAFFGDDFVRGIGAASASRQGLGSGFPGALLRGAAFSAGPSGDGAGVFAMDARFAPSASRDTTGFRCAR